MQDLLSQTTFESQGAKKRPRACPRWAMRCWKQAPAAFQNRPRPICSSSREAHSKKAHRKERDPQAHIAFVLITEPGTGGPKELPLGRRRSSSCRAGPFAQARTGCHTVLWQDSGSQASCWLVWLGSFPFGLRDLRL